MELEQILKLIDAGYTKDEIMKMNEPEEEEKKEEEKKEEVKEVTEEKKVESGDSSLEMTVKALADTVNKLNTSVSALQSANIDKAATDKANSGDKLKETIDSFLETL